MEYLRKFITKKRGETLEAARDIVFFVTKKLKEKGILL